MFVVSLNQQTWWKSFYICFYILNKNTYGSSKAVWSQRCRNLSVHIFSFLLAFLSNTFIDILDDSWSLCHLVSLAYRKCSEVLVACEDIKLQWVNFKKSTLTFLQLSIQLSPHKYATTFANLLSISEVEFVALQITFPKLDFVFDFLTGLKIPE